MSLVSQITAGFQRVAQEFNRGEQYQWWQTHAYHATGIGMQDMPIWIPHDATIAKLRYRVKSVGSGGTLTCELRHTDPTNSGNALSGSSLTPSVTPSFATPNIDVNADTLLWAYLTSVHPTPGTQLKVEMLVVKR